ncbi:Protein of unknown function [Pyronema omphalodes CBS 100304]|uniref:Uncharacterized protein n=1 Tax=Pyronema omphalodes (strain CBS 100304) TaxID=1076935 RepID=U4L2S2_PYROM|nr:Protein of unknown function [Pyronema omphalodes CBS 100304]
MEKRIQRLEEENHRLNQALAAAKEHPKLTVKRGEKIDKLKEKKAALKRKVALLRQKEKSLQKEVNRAGQDGYAKEMANMLKRYYEMEEQFGQMKREMAKDLKEIHAENEQKIQSQVQERLAENKTEIQKELERRFEDNETNIQGHGKEIQQQLDERFAENETKLQTQKNNLLHLSNSIETMQKKLVELYPVVLGTTFNEQGYFTTLMVRTPDHSFGLRYCE